LFEILCGGIVNRGDDVAFSLVYGDEPIIINIREYFKAT
jgi:hypothetical protein